MRFRKSIVVNRPGSASGYENGVWADSVPTTFNITASVQSTSPHVHSHNPQEKGLKLPNGNISSPHVPELFDNEDAWKERCEELGIEHDSES
jgi:hypothetical protein